MWGVIAPEGSFGSRKAALLVFRDDGPSGKDTCVGVGGLGVGIKCWWVNVCEVRLIIQDVGVHMAPYFQLRGLSFHLPHLCAWLFKLPTHFFQRKSFFSLVMMWKGIGREGLHSQTGFQPVLLFVDFVCCLRYLVLSVLRVPAAHSGFLLVIICLCSP